MNKLSMLPLECALSALEKSIAVTQELLKDKKTTEAHRETLQAGVIQHFESCYELCYKTLKRHLALAAGSAELFDAMSYQELIREGAEKGLILHARKWMDYRHKRNLTSHTYDPVTAAEVYQSAVAFYEDASDLLRKLQEKHT